MTIQIGPVKLLSPVILAPMSGVTDFPFRRLVKKFGAGLVVSEMKASEAMISQNKKTINRSINPAEAFPMSVRVCVMRIKQLTLWRLSLRL